MTSENLSGSPGDDKSNLAQAKDEVNKLLHELESMVDEVQHNSLTNFLAEWAVLSAMRITLALQNKTASPGESSWQAGETGEGV
jgi:hypothetical protein